MSQNANSRKVATWKGFNQLELIEQTIPKLQLGELLVKVDSCAICGSDLRIFKHGNDRVKSGQIVGHEISGTIVAGNRPEKFQIGDRVAIGADVPCGECDHCRSNRPNCCDTNYAIGHQFEGGFSEYMIVNSLTARLGPVSKLNAKTSLEEAALAEPLACCINGYEIGLMSPGKDVVIFGAGPIGVLLALLAPAYKANQVIVIDPNDSRLKKLQQLMPAVHTINPTHQDPVVKVLEITKNQGAGMIFTACPDVETHRQGIRMLAKRGVLNLFGGLPKTAPAIELNSNFIHYREAYITGSHGSTPEQHRKALDLIESGAVNVKPLITHKFALSQIEEAYKVAASGEAIKVLIKPNGV